MCSRLPFTTLEVEDIALAVGEACANGVKFSSLERSPIRITCKLWPDKLEITVRNRGTAFGKDTDCRAMPGPESLNEGGMGLYLISQVMDELKITSRNGVTTVRMVKNMAK